jgi:hypothetical protein
MGKSPMNGETVVFDGTRGFGREAVSPVTT